jgi:hypothetical protein
MGGLRVERSPGHPCPARVWPAWRLFSLTVVGCLLLTALVIAFTVVLSPRPALIAGCS